MQVRRRALLLGLLLQPALVCWAQAPAAAGPSPVTSSTDSGQATWKGVTPGSTRRHDVERLLGPPALVDTQSDASTLLVYPPHEQVQMNKVVVSPDGVVQQVCIGLFDDAERPALSALTARYGSPAKLSDYTARSPRSPQQIYQFAKKVGLWVIADSASDKVYAAVFYDPAHEPDIPIPTKTMEPDRRR
ncbi:MAG: hypothetical protein HY303_14075 [Candidatus Wallbacteria bacterium]|nr:hypothetical protein [Candidatus Wallbacteria bacterium]